MSSSNTPFPLLNYYAWKSRLGLRFGLGELHREEDFVRLRRGARLSLLPRLPVLSLGRYLQYGLAQTGIAAGR